jgi:hypothetical protein
VLATTLLSLQKLFSFGLPKIAHHSGFYRGFAGFCRVWADSGHGYAAAPTSLGSRTRL